MTNLYTNRALANHQIDNQTDCFNDVNYVLTNIDPKNGKALFRRANCYKQKSQFALAVADLETIISAAPDNKQAQQELKELKSKVE